MNMTQHHEYGNILKNGTESGSIYSWAESVNALLLRAGKHARTVSKATAALFHRGHASSLRVTWAGVLRSDCDRLVPEPSDEMRFQVANQMFLCEDGMTLVFDESWNQEAWGHMNGYRVVFQTDSARKRKAPLRQRLQQLMLRLVRI